MEAGLICTMRPTQEESREDAGRCDLEGGGGCVPIGKPLLPCKVAAPYATRAHHVTYVTSSRALSVLKYK